MVYNIKPLSVCWDLLPAGQALGKIPQRLFYVLIILRPALRFLIKPLPPLLFLARFFAAVIRPPLLFFAMMFSFWLVEWFSIGWATLTAS